MKAMLLPVTGTEASAGAGDESASGEKGAGQGFDAVLALVSAQVTSPVLASKTAAVPAVPPALEGKSAPVQTGGVRALQPGLVQSTAARAPQPGTAQSAATLGFGPWLGGDAIAAELALATPAAQVLPEQMSEDEGGEAGEVEEDAQDAPLVQAQEPRAAPVPAPLMPQAPIAAPLAPPAAAPQTPAIDASPAPRASATSRAQAQQPAHDAAAQVQAAQLFQQELFAAQPLAAAQGDATQASAPRPAVQAADAARVSAQPSAQRPSVRPAVQAADAARVSAPAFAPAGQAQRPLVDVAPGQASFAPVTQERTEHGAAAAALPGVQARAELTALSAQSDARLETAPVAAPQRGVPAAAAPVNVAPELEDLASNDPRVSVRMVEIGEPEQALAASVPEGERIVETARAEQQAEPASEVQQLEAQAAQSAPRVEAAAMLPNAEVQGARGLEAVVASLLRAGNRDASIEQPVARASAPRSAPLPAIETTASAEAAAARVKLAQGASDAQDALARERDEREPAREQLELPLLHAALPPELAPRKDAPIEQAAAPLPVLPQTPDPDALQAGKPGQNGASITIDHPELGAMDLLVQSQNGRIEVRATLETPHAAQVLRAHESALRYGIQQAGMTFGALRVRTRSGDGETVKARDNVKQRRRDHEWEA